MSERFLDAKLCEIEINGMKNVLHGELVFQNINGLIRNSEEGYRYNHVTGMYGNNGSGKSTVVQTMSFLRDLIAKDYFLPEGRKKRLASQHRLLINAKKNMTENRFLVFLKKEAETVFLEYSVRIEKCGEQYLIFHEKVRRKAKEEGKSWEAWKIMLEYDRALDEIRVDGRKLKKTGILFTKLMAYQEQREKSDDLKSFFFDDSAYDLLNESCAKNVQDTLCDLLEFVNYDLLTLEYDQFSETDHWVLPIMVRLPNNYGHVQGMLPIIMRPGEKQFVPALLYSVVVNVFFQIHTVLKTIIPDLDVGLKNIEQVVDKNGDDGYSFEVMSSRNGVEIPLIHESLGIKKIIFMINMLVDCYNDPRINLFIDEMDSGVFEHLLGQLVEAFDQKAKGFLFFTAHNLRPLEKINYKELYFTTTDPENRYAKLSIVGNNNPRNVYFHDLNLGRAKGADFAEVPSVSQIKLGFMKAGKTRNG